jgi:hypothetical protein
MGIGIIIKLTENSLKVCQDIAKKDPNFKFKIDDKNNRILIFTKNMSDAYKKGYWLKYKANCGNFHIVEVVE